MGERKGTNKYYPPDYNPNKGGLNKFLGTHALRERARKIHLGILIIRFEMPYNIWCEGCNNHIGMGVRYNAEKTKVGMYYSTPVYQFKMKCHLCDNYIEMKTDPGNLDYIIVSGARRQENRWDPLQNEQIVPEEKATSRRMADDAMFKLEHGEGDKAKASDQAPRLNKLVVLREERWKDNYAANCALRASFRAKRQDLKCEAERDRQLLSRTGLNIPLMPESSEDRHLASLLSLAPAQSPAERLSKTFERIDEKPVLPLGINNPQLARRLEAKASADSGLSRAKLGICLVRSNSTLVKEPPLSPLTVPQVTKQAQNPAQSPAKTPASKQNPTEEPTEPPSKRQCLVSGDYGSSTSEDSS